MPGVVMRTLIKVISEKCPSPAWRDEHAIRLITWLAPGELVVVFVRPEHGDDWFHEVVTPDGIVGYVGKSRLAHP